MKKVLFLTVLTSLVGCGPGQIVWGYDHSQVGTEQGIRAHNDGEYALMKTAKESADVESEYKKMRVLEEVEVTKRTNEPGWLELLVSPPTMPK